MPRAGSVGLLLVALAACTVEEAPEGSDDSEEAGGGDAAAAVHGDAAPGTDLPLDAAHEAGAAGGGARADGGAEAALEAGPRSDAAEPSEADGAPAHDPSCSTGAMFQPGWDYNAHLVANSSPRCPVCSPYSTKFVRTCSDPNLVCEYEGSNVSAWCQCVPGGDKQDFASRRDSDPLGFECRL